MPTQTPSQPRFSESVEARLRRWVLGIAYAFQPKRLHLIPQLTLMTAAHVLGRTGAITHLLRRLPFDSNEGLIGISNDLSVDALLSAYQRGIFPNTHLGPMKWWSPAQRAVLFFENAHIEKGVRKQIRQARFDVTFDEDFAAVMKACAEPRDGKTPLTWLTPRVMEAFWQLHRAGYAHSVEVWDLKPQLVGGMFGIAIGEIFFGESQFSRVRDASKIASAFLNCHLASWGFALRDAKWLTGYHATSGFTNIDRSDFETLLGQHVCQAGRIGHWEVDETLDVAGWKPEAETSKGLRRQLALMARGKKNEVSPLRDADQESSKRSQG